MLGDFDEGAPATPVKLATSVSCAQWPMSLILALRRVVAAGPV